MYKNFKKVFCTILIFVLAFSSSFSSMAFAANDEVSTPYGLNKPTVYWDFDDGQYNFAGEADYSDLYSEYLFTDASKVEIYVDNNHASKQLTVKLLKQIPYSVDWSQSTVKIPAGEDCKWEVNISADDTYILKFSGPSDFDGYIKRVS